MNVMKMTKCDNIDTIEKREKGEEERFGKGKYRREREKGRKRNWKIERKGVQQGFIILNDQKNKMESSNGK